MNQGCPATSSVAVTPCPRHTGAATQLSRGHAQGDNLTASSGGIDSNTCVAAPAATHHFIRGGDPVAARGPLRCSNLTTIPRPLPQKRTPQPPGGRVHEGSSVPSHATPPGGRPAAVAQRRCHLRLPPQLSPRRRRPPRCCPVDDEAASSPRSSRRRPPRCRPMASSACLPATVSPPLASPPRAPTDP